MLNKKHLPSNLEVSLIMGFLLFLFAAFYAGMSLYYLYNSKDNLESSDSIFNNEIVNFELKKNEAEYRETIFNEVLKVNNNYNKLLKDSIVINPNDLNELKKIYIINSLKTNVKNKKFNINLNEQINYLVNLETVQTTISIDFPKVENILNKSSFNSDNIKYGNYLDTKYVYSKSVNYSNLLVGLLIYILINLGLFFYGKIGLKDNYSQKSIEDELNSDKEQLDFVKKSLEWEKDIKEKDIKEVQNKLDILEINLQKYDFSKYFDKALYKNFIRSEKKANDFYNRATLMLVLGILFAVFGVIFFYLTIPDSNEFKDTRLYLYAVIRPGLVLLFIQSISFYLLKQYRSLINDYKYFYKDSINKLNLFSVYQLLVEKDNEEGYEKLIEHILNHKEEIIPINNVDEKMDNEGLLKIVDKIIEKVK